MKSAIGIFTTNFRTTKTTCCHYVWLHEDNIEEIPTGIVSFQVLTGYGEEVSSGAGEQYGTVHLMSTGLSVLPKLPLRRRSRGAAPVGSKLSCQTFFSPSRVDVAAPHGPRKVFAQPAVERASGG